jgi:hypothetical protein
MINLRHASRAGVLLPIALVFAACSGGTASSAPAATGGTDGAASASAPLATTGTGVEASPSGPALAFPSFDIGQLAKGLENVDSYRVSISINGAEQYSGVVVTKPVLSRSVTINQGGSPTHIIVIGTDAWIATGDGPYAKAPAELGSGMLAAFDPTLLVGAFSGAGWAENSTNVGVEQKNGVSATHYRIDSGTLIGALASLAPGASIDVWIADKGYLVALETKGVGATAGQDMSIQVTNVDDPSNKVEQPPS